MFSDDIVKQAFQRAHGVCECQRKSCGHGNRCNHPLKWENRGQDNSFFGWEAHHIVSSQSGGKDTLSNCQILCMDCHKNTESYGSHK